VDELVAPRALAVLCRVVRERIAHVLEARDPTEVRAQPVPGPAALSLLIGARAGEILVAEEAARGCAPWRERAAEGRHRRAREGPANARGQFGLSARAGPGDRRELAVIGARRAEPARPLAPYVHRAVVRVERPVVPLQAGVHVVDDVVRHAQHQLPAAAAQIGGLSRRRRRKSEDHRNQEPSHVEEDAFQCRSLRSDANGIIGGMPDERDELEQAWAALTDRERLLGQTVARRSAEIDARARRFDEIGADLDARRLMIEEAEEELVERERRVMLTEEQQRDRQQEIERAAVDAERLRERERELDVRASELRVLGTELAERGDWIAAATSALDLHEHRGEALDERESELQQRAVELADEERVHAAAQRQLELRASQLESRTAKLQAQEAALEKEKAAIEPRVATADEHERALDERHEALAERTARHAEQEKQLGRRAAKF